jgi:hypothetical protein
MSRTSLALIGAATVIGIMASTSTGALACGPSNSPQTIGSDRVPRGKAVETDSKKKPVLTPHCINMRALAPTAAATTLTPAPQAARETPQR